MSLHSITAECNGPLEAAHAYTDGDRYDLVQRGAAGQPQLDLSDQFYGEGPAEVISPGDRNQSGPAADVEAGCSWTLQAER